MHAPQWRSQGSSSNSAVDQRLDELLVDRRAQHHHFDLTPTATGTHVDHFEAFTGVLSPIVLAAIGTSTTRGFEEMNLALRDRLEANKG